SSIGVESATAFHVQRSHRPMSPTARLRLFVAILIVGIAACSSNEMLQPAYGSDDWDRFVTPPSDEDAEAIRAACGYLVGALPAETQGRSHPNGASIPIDHIVVVMQENRSFDHYFQKLPEFGQPDAEVAPPDFVNPGVDGVPVAPYHETHACVPGTVH